MSLLKRTRTVTAVWALVLAVGGVHAQDKPKAGKPVYAFFSSSAEFPLTGDPKVEPNSATYLESLSTRLNTENLIYAYVHNPSDREQNVNVSLQAGDAKSRSLLAQTATSIELKANETKRISFTSAKVAPAVPVAPVAAPVVTDKPKDGTVVVVPPRGDKLPASADNLYLRVVGKDKKLDVLGNEDDSTYAVIAKSPVGFECEARAANKTITVEVKYTATAKRLSNAPVKVRLDLRPDLNRGLIASSALEGTFAAELPALEQGETATATLVAKGVEFNSALGQKLTFGVTIDGYDRAYLFETAFDGTKPVPIGNKEPGVTNVRLSSYAQVPGKPVTIAVEADGVRDGQPVELLVDRLGDGVKFEVLRKFPTARSREVYAFVGDDGAIALTPVVQDWAVEFPTLQVAGKRAFAVRVNATDSKPPQVLIVDRTPPAGVAFVDVPKKATVLVGATITLSAVGTDAESQIDRVYFFTGETPPAVDGKPAAGSRVILGLLGKDKLATTYTTAEPLRLPEQKGELRVGVVVFNRVGLSSVAELTLYVNTKPLPPEKPTTGSILGRAVQAGRPQPGLAVSLTNAAGKVVKEIKSDALGKFEFKELPPGSYTVVAVKKADANASGRATVEVKADKDPTLIKELVIKR